MFNNAGQPFKSYTGWNPFEYKEICQFFGAIMAHGVCMSPKLSMKFSSQQKNPVNENDFVAWPMRPAGGTKRLK